MKQIFALVGAVMAAGILLSFSPAFADDSPPCGRIIPGIVLDRKLELAVRPPISYPGGQENFWGEGWVALEFDVGTDGIPTNFRVADALGAASFIQSAISAWGAARYEPAVHRGAPIATHGATVEVRYLIEGENRADTHAVFATNYDRAYKLRQAGRHREAAAVLKQTLGTTLNLYELATLSYGLAVTYNALGDRHRAFYHISHALIESGEFADKGVRRAAFVMGIELAAQLNMAGTTACWYEYLIEQYPDVKNDKRLRDLAEGMQQIVAGSSPLHTEVELVETNHPGVPTRWDHLLLRRSATLTTVSGNVSEVQVSCQTTAWRKQAGARLEISLPPIERCTIAVQGDVGARFTFDER